MAHKLTGRRPPTLLRYRLLTHDTLPVAVWEAQTEDSGFRILLTQPMLEQMAAEFRKVAKHLTKRPVARRGASPKLN